MRLVRLLLLSSVLLAAYSTALLVYLFSGAWAVVGIVAGYGALKKGRALYAHGTARWATWRDLPENTGFLIGRMTTRSSLWPAIACLFNPRVSSAVACDAFLSSLRKRRKELVRVPAIHTAVFAPTGAGKGVSCVIPHLLTNPDSCVVLDPKGENALKTAHARRRMGNKVVILDPFDVLKTRKSDTFNPLDFIHADSDTAIDDCDALANALVVRTGNEHEPHWNESAEKRIGAFAACIIQHGGGNLQDVSRAIADPQESADSINLMLQSDAWEGTLKHLAHELMQPEKKELAGILSTVSRQLKWLNTPLVARNIKTSSFDPAELVKGKMTIYLVLPVEYLQSHAGLLRMWISSLIRAVVKCGLQDRRRVYFLLDEAGCLGHMEALDNALNIGRGFGLRMMLIYQNIGQLKKCWPDSEQVVHGNCTEMFFAVNEPETSEFISKRLGAETIVVDSGGGGGGTSQQQSNYSYSRSWNTGWQQMERKLLTPDEVEQLDDRLAITFHPGCPPICTELVRYFEEPTLGRRPKRFWPHARAMFDAVFLLAVTALVAFLLTQFAGEASPSAVQPSVSADPFGSDYWKVR